MSIKVKDICELFDVKIYYYYNRQLIGTDSDLDFTHWIFDCEVSHLAVGVYEVGIHVNE